MKDYNKENKLFDYFLSHEYDLCMLHKSDINFFLNGNWKVFTASLQFQLFLKYFVQKEENFN